MSADNTLLPSLYRRSNHGIVTQTGPGLSVVEYSHKFPSNTTLILDTALRSIHAVTTCSATHTASETKRNNALTDNRTKTNTLKDTTASIGALGIRKDYESEALIFFFCREIPAPQLVFFFFTTLVTQAKANCCGGLKEYVPVPTLALTNLTSAYKSPFFLPT